MKLGCKIVSLLFLIALLLSYNPAETAASQPDPLTTAWQHAQAVGTYEFTAQIEQILIPRASPAMLGQHDEHLDMQVQGQVILPDWAQLQIRLEGTQLDLPEIQLIQEGSQVYILNEGERVPIENPLAFGAPAPDYLSYLAAIENVQQLDEASPQGFARFTYDLDGPRYAAYFSKQIETAARSSHLGSQNPLYSPLLESMTGRGELWLDANGLPRRQILDLEFSEINRAYDARVHVSVDFTFPNSDSPLQPVRPIQSITWSPDPGSIAAYALAIFMFVAVIAATRAYACRRWVYSVTAVLIALILTFSLPLQALAYAGFQKKLNASDQRAEFLWSSSSTNTGLERADQDPSGLNILDQGTQAETLLLVNNTEPALQCGDGELTADSDGDGLNDAAENCLGTNPYDRDSDHDTLSDYQEITGFESGGHSWNTDPLAADSNHDGLIDSAEWPAPTGYAPELGDGIDPWDPDGDGIPNVWDRDNDGDGLEDRLDLSPFVRTDYAARFDLSTQAGDFDGYQYIEIQVQPENPAHLRFNASALDWPIDTQGQITDTATADQDLRLVPMLRIHVNQAPSVSLAQAYGIAVFDQEDGQDILVPLTPVGSGGQISAFHAKVAYEPGQLEDIRWSAEFIWLVNRIGEAGGPEAGMLQVYPEDAFRVTGLQITKNRAFESAILGTPGSPDDDRQIFQLLFGLSASFLNNQNPDLAEIQQRFSNPNTDIVSTWGIPAIDVAIDYQPAYDHLDQGLIATVARTAQFLADPGEAFNPYPTDSTPALITLYQYETGIYKLDQAGFFEPNSVLGVNMVDVPLSMQRGLKADNYVHETGGWRAMFLEETLAMLQVRYADLSATLDSLIGKYPDLTAENLHAVLVLFYSSWHIGQRRLVTLDGQIAVPYQKPDIDIFTQLTLTQTSALPAYLLEIANLGLEGGGVRIRGTPADLWSYQQASGELAQQLFYLELGVISFSTTIYESAEAYNSDIADFVLTGWDAFSLTRDILKFARTIAGIGEVAKIATNLTKTAKFLKVLGVAMDVLDVAAFGTSLIFAGINYAKMMDELEKLPAGSGLRDDLETSAASTLGCTIAVNTLVLALSLGPLGFVGWALSLVDFILSFFDIEVLGSMIEALTMIFGHAETLTWVSELTFSNTVSDLRDPDLGTTAGNTFQLKSVFSGIISESGDGSYFALRDSRVAGQFKGGPFESELISVNDRASEPGCWTLCSSAFLCELRCMNAVQVDYELLQAQINLGLTLQAGYTATTYHEYCAWFSCDTKTDLWDEWGDETYLYLDVLPATLDEFWSWSLGSHEFNPDRDADGLANASDPDPDAWDTDHDFLSDQFEQGLGTSPLMADTDQDGLDDGYEYQLGSHPLSSDSDQDGLPDCAEVNFEGNCGAAGPWSAGWLVDLPGWQQPVRVFSSPVSSDADGDGLNDSTERDYGTSPHAYNGAPSLILAVEPFEISPEGAAGTYLKAGDEVRISLSIASVGPLPITSTLTVCLPDWLGNLHGGGMQGDRQPPQQVASPVACPGGHGITWSFAAAYTLQIRETANTSLTATVSENLLASQTAEVVAYLPYPIGNQPGTITARAAVVADADLPTVTLLAPEDGAFLGGGTSYYVIGGLAGDDTSWIETVELDLPADAGLATATGTGLWAYTWELPQDGSYTLTARAYDHVGHASPAVSRQVLVDNTPPIVNLDWDEGAFISAAVGDVIQITLTGTATDNLSGLTRIQVSTDNRPWREVWSSVDGPLSAGWSADWQLSGEISAQGEHVVAVRALDRAGNPSSTLTRTLIVDLLAPTDELTNRSYLLDPPHVPAGESLVLHGVANDQGRMPESIRPSELTGSLDAIEDATIWLGLPSVAAGSAGVQVAWLGDFNGDRLADLVVGLPGADPEASGGTTGLVSVVYGQAGGWPNPTDLALLDESRTSFIGEAGSGIGAWLAAAGDVNGDGFSDLLIGDPAGERVFLVFGRPGWFGSNQLLDGCRGTEWAVINLAGLGELAGLSAAGDVNGDGYDDLLIGTSGADGLSYPAYLLLGRANNWRGEMSLERQAAAVISTGAWDARPARMGDLDADGYDEFAITSENHAYLYTGSPFFSLGGRQALEFSDALDYANAMHPAAVAAVGDVNGDSYADFLMGAGDNPRLVYGDASLADGDWNTQPLGGFWPSPSGFLAAPGDVDADGLADLLLGTSSGDAYLILGANVSQVAATLTGVAAAASTIYPAGADLNSDGSSDLLLVPAQDTPELSASSLEFGTQAYIDPAWLPVSGIGVVQPGLMLASPLGTDTQTVTHTVDDDGCSGCFSSIQAAIDAAQPGDQILVQPGVYSAFNIDSKHDLTIQGVHADAVFVDADNGSYAVKISAAQGTQLVDLTLQNAVHAVWLAGSGVGGYLTPTLTIRLEGLLIHSFSEDALYMDRISTATLSHCTLAGGGQIGSTLINIYGPADPDLVSNWTTVTTDAFTATHDGGGIFASDQGLYLLPGADSQEFYQYAVAGDTWQIKEQTPVRLTMGTRAVSGENGSLHLVMPKNWTTLDMRFSGGGDDVQVIFALAGDEDTYLYLGGSFTTANEQPIAYLARWDGTSVSALGSGVDGTVRALVVDQDGNLYAGGDFSTAGGQPAANIARWDGSNWSALGSGINCTEPYCSASVKALVVDQDGNLYAAGHFSTAGGQPAANIARWDGSSWSALGSGINCTEPYCYVWVDALAVDQEGNVYAGGDFSTAGGQPAANIARWDGSSWSTLGVGLDNGVFALSMDQDGNLYAGGNFSTAGGQPAANIAQWDGSNWAALAAGIDEEVYSLQIDSKNNLFAGYRQQGTPSNNIQRWSTFHYQYDASQDEWHLLEAIPHNSLALAGDGSGHFYALTAGPPRMYRYDLNSDLWNIESYPPFLPGPESAMAVADRYLYALASGSDAFWRYDRLSGEWTTLEALPGVVAGSGCALAWDGSGSIFAIPGGNGRQFLRYEINSNQWQVLGDGSTATPDQDTPAPVNAGGGLAFAAQELYFVPGGDLPGLWRYLKPDKLLLDRVAFVVPATTSTASWLLVDGLPPEASSLPADFGIAGQTNAWVAGSGTFWSPLPFLVDNQVLTHVQASFLDPAQDIYRLGSTSGLQAGYHSYRPEAVVAVTGAEFSSLQSAILSGANRILVRPGIYQESIYLLSGVQVYGAGADRTILSAVNGSDRGLVRLEGVTGAVLSGLTLAGDGVSPGLMVEDGARAVKAARLIIRDTGNAVVVAGISTGLELVNATLVKNQSGMLATACAGVDVRNSIFAYQMYTGLSYNACAPTILHTYNDYWGNGTDIDDTSGAPIVVGTGELFLDPLFLDLLSNDYRTLDVSPVIDAGDPGDPAPPGTGQRVDLGYIEQGRATYYADDDYCEYCENDGLTWGVDAFTQVQLALDAVVLDMETLEFPTASHPYTVGVAPGVYSETLTIPSHVTLTGSGADQTILSAGGAPNAVSLDGVVQAAISGFAIQNASAAGIAASGAANAITITRNLFLDNSVAIHFSEQATGQMAFNTVTGSSEAAVVCDGVGTWLVVENNILSGNDTGLANQAGAQLFHDFNLLNNATNFTGDGLGAAPGELVDLDPGFAGGGLPYHLQPDSPAVDRASPIAPVPPGGGVRADMGYQELLASPLTLLLGKAGISTTSGNSGIAAVQVGITLADPAQPVTATLPDTWQTVTLAAPGATVSYWQKAYSVTAEGLYRVYTKASDIIANQETRVEDWYAGAFVADQSAPLVSWVAPVNGTEVTSPFEIMAEASDYPGGIFAIAAIQFMVDGEAYPANWTAAPWQPSGGQPRSFRAWIDLAPGEHTLYAIAQDRAGHASQSEPVYLVVVGTTPEDTTPPAVEISSPETGASYNQTVSFAGTASDAGSGLASVEVSVDGGFTWMPAEIDAVSWSLDWQVPVEQDHVSYPVRVNAKDRAGNSAVQEISVTVDTVAPQWPAAVEFSIPAGSHLDAFTQLAIDWYNAPLDGSGSGYVLLSADQLTGTLPAQVIPGTGTIIDLDTAGSWYVHMAIQDPAGNQSVRHFGPWHIGTFAEASLPFSLRQQSIEIDGRLDLDHGEWQIESELLDDDESGSERQLFFTTWDGETLYLGWQGAWWTLEGTLWIYLETGIAGTDQPVEPVLGLGSLPLQAAYAVMVTGRDPEDGALWYFSEGSWHRATEPLEFAHGASGATEIRIPLSSNQLKLVAIAVDDDGWAWSVFPTLNPTSLGTQAGSSAAVSSAYNWDSLSETETPNLDQPQGTHVLLEMDSPEAPLAAWGPGEVLRYILTLTNLEARRVEGLRLDLQASPGLTYQAVTGANCLDCALGDHWILQVPDLEPGDRLSITIDGQLDQNLGQLELVTSSAILQTESVAISEASLSHRVDGLAPSVWVNMPAGQSVGPGWQTITGVADDGFGSGVVQVCVDLLDGSGCQAATGTRYWSAEVDFPEVAPGELISQTVQIQALDAKGNLATSGGTFIVDGVTPELSFSLPGVLSGSYAVLTGVTRDPGPTSSQVKRVEIQLDDPDNPWLPASGLLEPDEIGDQSWFFNWMLAREDHKPHQVRVRAFDLAGNLVQTGWQETIIDNVAPQITMTTIITETSQFNPVLEAMLAKTNDLLLAGTASDGSGVERVYIQIYTPDGQNYLEIAEWDGTNWRSEPQIDPGLPGFYVLWVEAIDIHGNLAVVGPFIVHTPGEEFLYLPLITNLPLAVPDLGEDP